MPSKITDRRVAVLRWALPVAIILVTLLAYAPNVHNGFLNWDDQQNFLENRHFGGLSWARVGWAFGTRHLGVYQPVAWLLLCAQY